MLGSRFQRDEKALTELLPHYIRATRRAHNGGNVSHSRMHWCVLERKRKTNTDGVQVEHKHTKKSVCPCINIVECVRSACGLMFTYGSGEDAEKVPSRPCIRNNASNYIRLTSTSSSGGDARTNNSCWLVPGQSAQGTAALPLSPRRSDG